MSHAGELNEIFERLPPEAQREALDFLLFLGQRYPESGPLAKKPSVDEATTASIRDHPAVGMWADRSEDSQALLARIRSEQWRT